MRFEPDAHKKSLESAEARKERLQQEAELAKHIQVGYLFLPAFYCSLNVNLHSFQLPRDVLPCYVGGCG
jgi:hypothetical protein